MISYAQNFEDIMLWRALKHIEKGFYIDVGAAWPDKHSVTKIFYDAGWSGINIEPDPMFYEQLVKNRGRDLNLNIAVSDQNGEMTIHLIENTGLSSLDFKIASSHQNAGFRFRDIQSPVRTLQDIWQQHIPPNREVHFLKVDVEGLEEKVIRGNDWGLYRPWIVLVEATLPLSQIENYQEWEKILIGENYIFAYADGLNRFYVAAEQSNLLIACKYPPNVFDGFVLAEQQRLAAALVEANESLKQSQLQIAVAEAQVSAKLAEQQSLEAALGEANEKLKQANLRADEAWQKFYMIANSRSWRLTYPLRLLGKGVRWFVREDKAWFKYSPTGRLRRVLDRVIILLIRFGIYPIISEIIYAISSQLWFKIRNRLRRDTRKLSGEIKVPGECPLGYFLKANLASVSTEELINKINQKCQIIKTLGGSQ